MDWMERSTTFGRLLTVCKRFILYFTYAKPSNQSIHDGSHELAPRFPSNTARVHSCTKRLGLSTLLPPTIVTNNQIPVAVFLKKIIRLLVI